MFSVMYTGMNFFPLCTASVCPTISGTMVERRDHVLITFYSAPRFITSTFSSRWVSMNGPFFGERPIKRSLNCGLRNADCGFDCVILQSAIRNPQSFGSPLDDEFVRRLPVTRLVALG